MQIYLYKLVMQFHNGTYLFMLPRLGLNDDQYFMTLYYHSGHEAK